MCTVVATNLTKHYRSGRDVIEAVQGVSLQVSRGELFGIIGPDGAGKTSLFRMLTTLLVPDNGNARVEGLDVVKDYKAIRDKIGYMPGRFSLYPDLSVMENLQFFATIFKTTIAANYSLINEIFVQLQPFKSRKAGKLSGGMKQKLALCCALIHKPSVLFLDEPTTGVDAVSRMEFWDILQRLKRQGITILVSTPYMDEASLCDQIALMQNGTIMVTGTPEAIIDAFIQPLLGIRSQHMFQLLKDLPGSTAVDQAYAFGEYNHAVMKQGYDEQNLVHYLELKGHRNIEIRRLRPGIEDCFMHLMQSRHD